MNDVMQVWEGEVKYFSDTMYKCNGINGLRMSRTTSVPKSVLRCDLELLIIEWYYVGILRLQRP